MSGLAGTVVLDLARRYPGAYSTMILGDFGAEVIKIDPPGAALPLLERDTSNERFTAYYALDRNKKSIIIDLKKEDGLEAFYRLVRRADVLVEGFRPGVMSRLKADYATLKEMNPKLVYCSLTGYGHDGPYAGMPGHDANYCALGGVLSLIGPRDGPPCTPSNFIADMAGAGLNGVIGILLALVARQRTGQGQFVDVTYLDSVVSLLTGEDASAYFYTGKVPRRGQTQLTGDQPWYNIYRCKDGEYFTVSCIESQFWENLCRSLGREDLVSHYDEPPAKRAEVISEFARIFLTRTRDEWFEFLKDKDVCIAPVNYLNETFSNPQVLHRHMVVEIDHPRHGKVRQVGIPIKLSETPGSIRSLGTVNGAHTEEVLLTLGYSQEEIGKLLSSTAVVQSPQP